MRRARLAGFVFALSLVASAHASVPLPGAVPAGSARLTFWGFAVYDARLWVTPGFRQGSFDAHAFALELSYLREFRASDIARRTIDEMRRAAPLDAAQARRWEEQLEQVLPDVREGDRLLGVHHPGRGAEFFRNGQRLGEIADAEFARRFFAIWLGPTTSEPALREGLLAGTPP